jgi:hypothetical protein
MTPAKMGDANPKVRGHILDLLDRAREGIGLGD